MLGLSHHNDIIAQRGRSVISCFSPLSRAWMCRSSSSSFPINSHFCLHLLLLLLLSHFSLSDSVRPHRRQPTRLPHPWDSPGKNTGVGCHFLFQCVKVKSLSRVQIFITPWTVAYQAPPSMGFSRQEYWSGVPHIKLSEIKELPALLDDKFCLAMYTTSR